MASTEAVVALLLRLSSGGASIGWEDVGCASLLAVQQATARNASVVPALSTLSPGFAWRALLYDTESTRRGGSQAFLSARAAGAHAMVGPARSSVAEIVSSLGGIYQTPTISYWAASPSLSDTTAFPFFARTYLSDTTSAGLLASVLYGGAPFSDWYHVALLHVNDPWGNNFRLQMESELDQLRVAEPGVARSLYAHAFSSGNLDSIAVSAAESTPGVAENVARQPRTCGISHSRPCCGTGCGAGDSRAPVHSHRTRHLPGRAANDPSAREL